MTDVVLDPITSGYNLTKVNANFVKIEAAINEDLLNLSGGNNSMQQDLDMNGHSFLNLVANPNDPGSILTVEVADTLYYNVVGDTLTGPMNVNGQVISNLPVPTVASQPVRKDQFDVEQAARIARDAAITTAYQSSDASLQAQITAAASFTASQFSTVSWHAQTVTNSLTIPANQNAWSFGPVLTIGAGVTVTIGSGSFWTIANGKFA